MPFLYNLHRTIEYRRYLRNHATKTERILWHYLRRRQVDGKKFRRQYSIRGYIVDFYCPELKLAVEIDGIVHTFQDRQDRDHRRQQRLEGYGFTFFRCTSEDVYVDVEGVVRRIKEKIYALNASPKLS